MRTANRQNKTAPETSGAASKHLHIEEAVLEPAIDAAVRRVAARLHLTPEQFILAAIEDKFSAAEQAPEALRPKPLALPLEKQLWQKVERYVDRHGLTPDGVIGCAAESKLAALAAVREETRPDISNIRLDLETAVYEAMALLEMAGEKLCEDREELGGALAGEFSGGRLGIYIRVATRLHQSYEADHKSRQS